MIRPPGSPAGRPAGRAGEPSASSRRALGEHAAADSRSPGAGSIPSLPSLVMRVLMYVVSMLLCRCLW